MRRTPEYTPLHRTRVLGDVGERAFSSSSDYGQYRPPKTETLRENRRYPASERIFGERKYEGVLGSGTHRRQVSIRAILVAMSGGPGRGARKPRDPAALSRP